ncbi:MAG: septum formation initiator family protein [bacterium]|nr:septum formation initiator family protein [bacterium]
MRDFQRKRKIRKTLYSKGTLAVVFLLLVLVGKATLGLYTKERDSREHLDRVEGELSSLTSREQSLKGDIARLETPEGIETEIREQFQVAKPGERMVVLVEPQKTKTAETVPTQSLISRFFDIFR